MPSQVWDEIAHSQTSMVVNLCDKVITSTHSQTSMVVNLCDKARWPFHVQVYGVQFPNLTVTMSQVTPAGGLFQVTNDSFIDSLRNP